VDGMCVLVVCEFASTGVKCRPSPLQPVLSTTNVNNLLSDFRYEGE
jgi:hypothetical protein